MANDSEIGPRAASKSYLAFLETITNLRPEGSQARVVVDLKDLESCFEEHNGIPER